MVRLQGGGQAVMEISIETCFSNPSLMGQKDSVKQVQRFWKLEWWNFEESLKILEKVMKMLKRHWKSQKIVEIHAEKMVKILKRQIEPWKNG